MNTHKVNLSTPLINHLTKDWNDMERIWQYIYSKDQLQTFSEEHPVLLTEAPLNPRRNREKAAEIFFDTFNVPALFVSLQVGFTRVSGPNFRFMWANFDVFKMLET